jgi:hypothetical protein
MGKAHAWNFSTGGGISQLKTNTEILILALRGAQGQHQNDDSYCKYGDSSLRSE